MIEMRLKNGMILTEQNKTIVEYDTSFAGSMFMFFGYSINNYKSCEYCVEKENRKNFRILKFIFISTIYALLRIINTGIAMSVREYGKYGLISIFLFFVIGCLGTILYVEIAQLLCKLELTRGILTYVGQNTLPILGFHMFIFLVLDEIIKKQD